jgi:hypothetical protein
MQILEILKKP